MIDYGTNRTRAEKLIPTDKTNEQVLEEASKNETVLAGVAEQFASEMPEVNGSKKLRAEQGSAAKNAKEILGSLSKLMSKRDGDAQDAEIASAISKLKDIVGDVQTGRLLADEEAKRNTLAEKQDKIEEQQEKQEEAAKARKKSRFFRRLVAAFTIIASVASIVMGTLLAVVPGTQVLGAMMIAGGVMGIVGAADSLHAVNTGKGFLSEKAALAITIVGAVIAVATIFVSMGNAIAAAAKSAVSKIGDVANMAMKILANMGQAFKAGISKAATMMDDMFMAFKTAMKNFIDELMTGAGASGGNTLKSSVGETVQNFVTTALTKMGEAVRYMKNLMVSFGKNPLDEIATGVSKASQSMREAFENFASQMKSYYDEMLTKLDDLPSMKEAFIAFYDKVKNFVDRVLSTTLDDVKAFGAQMKSSVGAMQNYSEESLKLGSTVVSGTSQVGEGIGTVGVAALDMKTASLSADAKQLAADTKELEAFMQALDDFIDILISQISGENSRFAEMLSDVQTSINDRGQTFGRARFSG